MAAPVRWQEEAGIFLAVRLHADSGTVAAAVLHHEAPKTTSGGPSGGLCLESNLNHTYSRIRTALPGIHILSSDPW